MRSIFQASSQKGNGDAIRPAETTAYGRGTGCVGERHICVRRGGNRARRNVQCIYGHSACEFRFLPVQNGKWWPICPGVDGERIVREPECSNASLRFKIQYNDVCHILLRAHSPCYVYLCTVCAQATKRAWTATPSRPAWTSAEGVCMRTS
jgi:hypothetical protein